jgi:hypothetical protein
MQKRGTVAVVLAALALLGLAGCQAVKPGTFTRADAQADVSAWTQDAQTAVGSPSADTRSDGYETCRTDHGFFTTTSQWRTITYLTVPKKRQAAAISTLSAAFVARNWTSTTSGGSVSLSGPKGASRTGLIRVERGGGSTLVISVVSPCYA